MKTILGLTFILIMATPANAVVCAKGVYRAGCVGPHGAVTTHRPVAVVHPYGTVVRPGVRVAPVCRYVNGVRVCR